MRLRRVRSGARADGQAIRDLPIGEHGWISLIVRDGKPTQTRGSSVLRAGDEILVLAEGDEALTMQRVFEDPATGKGGESGVS